MHMRHRQPSVPPISASAIAGQFLPALRPLSGLVHFCVLSQAGRLGQVDYDAPAQGGPPAGNRAGGVGGGYGGNNPAIEVRCSPSHDVHARDYKNVRCHCRQLPVRSHVCTTTCIGL